MADVISCLFNQSKKTTSCNVTGAGFSVRPKAILNVSNIKSLHMMQLFLLSEVAVMIEETESEVT